MGSVIVCGLGWGDEGKGAITDYLTSEAASGRKFKTVVRYNGGAQAGHNVTRPDGSHHTFSQFGSGTFNRVPTHLSRFVAVEPIGFFRELQHLEDLWIAPKISVDPECLVTTPFHAALNQIRERARGLEEHGSCGVGYGETVRFALQYPDDAIRVRHLVSVQRLLRLLMCVREWAYGEARRLGYELGVTTSLTDLVNTYRRYIDRVDLLDTDWVVRQGDCVFEGAQGVLLDEWYGFHPFTTWSTCTFQNALELAPTAYRLGVTRTYSTRHGAGPFPSEGGGEFTPEKLDPHNGFHPWQGSFRVGALDLVLMRYALEACGGIDGLAVTHTDVSVETCCTSYRLNESPWTPEVRRYTPGYDEYIPGYDEGQLGYQGWLTECLAKVQPVLEAWTSLPSHEVVGQCPVITSCGVTYWHKRGRLP